MCTVACLPSTSWSKVSVDQQKAVTEIKKNLASHSQYWYQWFCIFINDMLHIYIECYMCDWKPAWKAVLVTEVI